ncbi:winged helix-turn-helix domain-containing protein [Streptomyces sp. NBC_00879]|uniref:ArsR/SmtB family transcription factor n=1 Tax=Streptomyces sp. NBC_00879 TaxID=2975855 RepID=UPI00386E43A5|nr:winged helix-turn-helix domain-containing protein [Streptomyces sp. NBC_00879]
MLRLYFTVEDLARTRVALLGPLAETQLSLRMLQRRDEKVLFDGWRRRTHPRVPHDVRELAAFVAGPRTWMVDFFTLLGPVFSIEEGQERLLSAPRAQLRAELAPDSRLERQRPSWLADSGSRRAVERLADALVAYHAEAVAPFWTGVQQHLSSHANLVGKLMATGGVSTALDSLAPRLRWRPPVLEVPDYAPWRAGNADFHLGGRGIILAPSLFCGTAPQLFEPDTDAEALLIYPAPRDAATVRGIWSPPQYARSHKALAALLGTTRAAILSTLVDGCTTIELARRLSISPASASEHTGILRQAGLASSTRYRNTVHHTLTQQGLSLLDGTSSAP